VTESVRGAVRGSVTEAVGGSVAGAVTATLGLITRAESPAAASHPEVEGWGFEPIDAVGERRLDAGRAARSTGERADEAPTSVTEVELRAPRSRAHRACRGTRERAPRRTASAAPAPPAEVFPP
jgi:hypothetical protein